ncbi:uncharacterized protein BO95DRAFT_71068 [Aspergillus brunneoviolaceus CBS 621.78]|uniref:Uncharacterized protein n=1 Tax=Aspergillus brunneoviolaceus CBS 621.78 TaxID=1450534 RepID=A0ACD1GF57_9EURO|nr:hypothetical protein BO95DRAFT_71068 [Aspergillus brunneoviolaceus CBS 621.78]RAH47852.1 hypothetical protein BO95DRAFT_71068 [Aspergillus brunneoviolaceus CBS 621.78]
MGTHTPPRSLVRVHGLDASNTPGVLSRLFQPPLDHPQLIKYIKYMLCTSHHTRTAQLWSAPIPSRPRCSVLSRLGCDSTGADSKTSSCPVRWRVLQQVVQCSAEQIIIECNNTKSAVPSFFPGKATTIIGPGHQSPSTGNTGKKTFLRSAFRQQQHPLFLVVDI